MRMNSLRPSNTLITATKLDKEILIRVPRPSALAANQVADLPFWDLAGKRLSLVVLPPGATTPLGFRVYAVKVIYGKSVSSLIRIKLIASFLVLLIRSTDRRRLAKQETCSARRSPTRTRDSPYRHHPFHECHRRR